MDLDASKEEVVSDSKDTKRIKKTPEQIEILAKAYAENNHPSEAVRMQLSAELGLTNRQLQMWFCNRRLKDRKSQKAELPSVSLEENGNSRSSRPKDSSDSNEYPAAVLASETENAAVFGRNGLKPPVQQAGEKRVRSQKQDFSPEPQIDWQKVFENGDLQTSSHFMALTSSESWQGEPYREDGPVIGFEFDSVPPGTFDMLIERPLENRKFVSFPHQNDDIDYVTADMRSPFCEEIFELERSAQKLQKVSDKKHEQKAKPNLRRPQGERSKLEDQNLSNTQVSRGTKSHTVYSENGFLGKLPRQKLSSKVRSVESNPPYVAHNPKSGYKAHDGHVGNGGRDPRSSVDLDDSSDESDDAKYFVEDLRGKESADKQIGQKNLYTHAANEDYPGYYYNRCASAEHTSDSVSEESN